MMPNKRLACPVEKLPAMKLQKTETMNKLCKLAQMKKNPGNTGVTDIGIEQYEKQQKIADEKEVDVGQKAPHRKPSNLKL
jgi:hypothetical protein